MKKVKLRNWIYSCCAVALLAIGCSDNNEKSVTDGNDDIENLSDNEYDLKATTRDKVLEVEQDVIDWYYPVSDRMAYRLLMEDVDLDDAGEDANAKNSNKKKKDFSGLDDKNDLPVVKVVREEPEDDYWMNYEQRNRKYAEMAEKMKDIPNKLDAKENKVKMKPEQQLEGMSIDADIKITDINNSRPPLFSKDCMGEENPEKCSNDAVAVWLKDKIDYPESALDRNHDGIERVRFTIGTSGEIVGDINVVSKNNPCSGCTEAAVAAVSEMPNWVPALQNGRPVSVEVVLPVKFRIK